MKRHFALLAAVLLTTAAVHASPPPGYKLQWADEFDGTQLDMKKWVYWGAGKRREAYNVPEAVTVRDGFLTISTYTENGKNYTGMISTDKLFERRYGYWEARIKWSDAPGTFSDFWSWTWTMEKSDGAVANNGAEIDFVEHRAVNEKMKPIPDTACCTLHCNGYGKGQKRKFFMTQPIGLAEGFHLYACEWTETAYRFFIDDKLVWSVEDPAVISKCPQFMILSTEVSNGWAGHIPAGGYGDRKTSKVKCVVDYVRWYSKP